MIRPCAPAEEMQTVCLSLPTSAESIMSWLPAGTQLYHVPP